VEKNFQRRFSVNVWCGIFGDRLDLWVLFLLIAVLIKQNVILFIIKWNKQLSGWDAISSVEQSRVSSGRRQFCILNHLNHFGDRWMDTHGPIRWPARFLDLNPLDFFTFIRNFRDNVYWPRPRTVKRKRIVEVWQEIPPNFLLNAKLDISRRYR
jgi:hypothetical protein